MRRCAMTVVLDDAAERVLLMLRHRFIIGRWVWELPGGYADDGEDPAAAAAREVEEETGGRPRRMEHVPVMPAGDRECGLPAGAVLGSRAEKVGAPQADETAGAPRRGRGP
jgi:8-oxo-dGTP pyrophosphatase MutT (NUDIX family)